MKLFNVWDSFREDGSVRHIFAPRKRAFSIPYPVMLVFGGCQDISATTKGVWSIFLVKDFIHETWIEILLSFKNVGQGEVGAFSYKSGNSQGSLIRELGINPDCGWIGRWMNE